MESLKRRGHFFNRFFCLKTRGSFILQTEQASRAAVESMHEAACDDPLEPEVFPALRLLSFSQKQNRHCTFVNSIFDEVHMSLSFRWTPRYPLFLHQRKTTGTFHSNQLQENINKKPDCWDALELLSSVHFFPKAKNLLVHRSEKKKLVIFERLFPNDGIHETCHSVSGSMRLCFLVCR